ncbi:uncharacterized protein LOC130630641 [Hydractinia symbiolongicarpus]|uniref:uncharacterized protein LOC130630641 n=1 Tax=Hydractinia symbiolongicarpus TaxID=13093 RepID=UPI00254CEE02|nr:uncharacterized protein LOC130630641 [Hydractinia symbiolongicarpus]XP_057300195.1 uncharacterized protein LOC130630641 [Hydractinia symbiolongicarpus]
MDENIYKLQLLTLANEAEIYLRELFHDSEYGNLPKDEKKLYSHMEKLDRSGKLSHLRPEQREIVLPGNKKTNSAKFDTILLSHFLLTHAKLTKPARAALEKIGEEKNLILSNPDITYQEFETRWNNMETFLRRLGYPYDCHAKYIKAAYDFDQLDALDGIEDSLRKSEREIKEYNDKNKFK